MSGIKQVRNESFFLDVTLNRFEVANILLKNANGKQLTFKKRVIFPRLYKYQHRELLTLVDNSPKEELQISTKTLRWLIRDLLKHPRFIFTSIFSTKRLTITGLLISDLPIQVELVNQQGRLWVSRHSVEEGIFPSNLDESLEYDRLRNPSQFQVLIRSAYGKPEFKSTMLYKNSSYSFYLGKYNSPSSFQVEFEEFEDSEVLHGKIAISGARILQVSNVRKELIRRSPRCVHQIGGNTTVLNTFREKERIENAVFFGSNLNWFHFIVECLTRYTAIPESLSRGIPTVLEVGVHPNIVEICRILSQTEPILISPFEKLGVRSLLLAREIGVDDAIDASPREPALLEVRHRVLAELKLNTPAENPLGRYFFRRKKNLFRPLQNESQILNELKRVGFESIFPEDLSLVELIELLQCARMVVVESGAAMTNLMFAPRGLEVIELNPGDGGYGFWEKFLNPYELIHHGIVGQRRRIGPKGFSVDGFNIDVRSVLRIVEASNR